MKINIVEGGGAVWELKFDPNRFREGIKNDIETRRKKRDERKSIKSDKRRFKKSSLEGNCRRSEVNGSRSD